MNEIIKKKQVIGHFINTGVLVHKALLEDVEKNIDAYYSQLQTPSLEVKKENNVSVVFSYVDFFKKRTVQDFVAYYNARFKSMELLLRSRPELSSVTSISRLSPGVNVSVIGIVVNKQKTKNNSVCLDIEDRSGKPVRVVISAKTSSSSDSAALKKANALALANDIPLDQVIGVAGRTGDNVIFADNLVLPDIPLQEEVKKSPDEAYAVVLSDTEFGSKNFMRAEFNRLISWLRGEWGSDALRAIASKVGYVFLVGDVVAGIGVYPRQEAELEIKDIFEQYAAAASALSLIPSNIRIIVCAGNHDSVRLSEPQPCLDKEHAKPLYALPNVTMVSNPSLVNIHASSDFAGFNVLLYHGGSYPYYADTVDSIRSSGRPMSDRTDLVMRFLLQCRHLAPAHSSTLYIPDTRKDYLVIDTVPDYLLSGHMHKSRVLNYRGVGIVCGSCWQPTTQYQQKLGHTPEPCIVPVLDLKQRGVLLLDFKNDSK
ncbi:metallophosphoesterase [Candidatus Woesearchaeota archaeon]|nr:metallophosphoesterase [Candidatus Woesearchaeota archaeon]